MRLEYRRRGEERKREGKGRREGEKEFSPSRRENELSDEGFVSVRRILSIGSRGLEITAVSIFRDATYRYKSIPTAHSRSLRVTEAESYRLSLSSSTLLRIDDHYIRERYGSEKRGHPEAGPSDFKIGSTDLL